MSMRADSMNDMVLCDPANIGAGAEMHTFCHRPPRRIR